MAKNDTKLEMPDIEPAAPAEKAKDKKGAPAKKSNNKKPRRSFIKYCRDIISELKKVNWAKFKDNNGASGVLSNTVTVLIVVLIFMVVISLFDLGLTEIVKLLLNANA